MNMQQMLRLDQHVVTKCCLGSQKKLCVMKNRYVKSLESSQSPAGYDKAITQNTNIKQWIGYNF